MRYLKILFVCFHHLVFSQDQGIVSLNDNWGFKLGTEKWRTVNIPHTWNTNDPFDDQSGYHRGGAVYRKKLTLNENQVSQKLFLRFEAVNQEAIVFVNDQLAGRHQGGYTAFNVAVAGLVRAGDNDLRVEVSNSHNPDVVPLKGDFNFYGGIYRDVWLVSENHTYFDKTGYGNDAIYITPITDGITSLLQVKGDVRSSTKERCHLEVVLRDALGKSILRETRSLRLKSPLTSFSYDFSNLKDILLWSPDAPNLYWCEITLADTKTGEVLDTYSHQIGFRHFRFDPDEGFYLNGQPVKLIGANRHQDFEGLGNALDDSFHRRDVRLLKEMGANFFRTAHYPQDVAVLKEADKLGFVVTMEIPLDHDMTDSEGFRANARTMMQEMIHQYYNHPSICIWAVMNEMFLGRRQPEDQEKIDLIIEFAKELEHLSRQEDPTRYTLIPNHGDFPVYHESGMTAVPQIVGWNLYYGWYEAEFDGFSRFMENAHENLPAKPIVITEYGAGADPRIRSLDPERFDFSIDWQFEYHLAHLKQIHDIPFLSGAAVWILCDFGSESRRDAVTHINSKGLMTYDRKPKDTYYLYQAWLSGEPMIEILPTLFPVLPKSMGADTLYWPLKAATNMDWVSLSVNGRDYEEPMVLNGFAEWKVPLTGDQLYVEAIGTSGNDTIKVSKTYRLSDALNINLGANFYFYDPVSDELWLPDQKYQNGQSYGHIGGQEFRPRNRGVGSDRGIDLTRNDPVYQTQNQGLSKYNFDIESGEYEVLLLISNLDNKKGIQKVIINESVIERIDLGTLEPFTAYTRKYMVNVSQGLQVELINEKNQTILNGLKITKLD